MKKILLLSFLSSFLCPALMSCATYTALEEDVEVSKRMSLISGAAIERFEKDAVITLGCHNHRFHSMVIFEIMKAGILGLQAVHFNPVAEEENLLQRDLEQIVNLTTAHLFVPSKGRVLIDS